MPAVLLCEGLLCLLAWRVSPLAAPSNLPGITFTALHVSCLMRCQDPLFALGGAQLAGLLSHAMGQLDIAQALHTSGVVSSAFLGLWL